MPKKKRQRKRKRMKFSKVFVSLATFSLLVFLLALFSLFYDFVSTNRNIILIIAGILTFIFIVLGVLPFTKVKRFTMGKLK